MRTKPIAHIPSPRTGLWMAVAVSCAVLLGAYGFEYIGGLRPCTLCYYQRLPYALAIILGFAAFLRPALNRPGLAALTLTFMVSAGLGAYHAGVEQKWWPGPQGCSAGGNKAQSVDALLAELLATPVVMCDEIPWSLFGLSLAGYNMLISAALAVFTAAIWYSTQQGRQQ